MHFIGYLRDIADKGPYQNSSKLLLPILRPLNAFHLIYHTVSKNIIGAPIKQNNFGAIKVLTF